MAGNSEIKEDYTSSLADLTFNSKPLISVLTMLAEEYITQAKDIVEAIETHLSRVRTEVKLPILYLIDSVIKNLGDPYTALFCQNIVSTFCGVFEQVDEKTRAEMYRLRQTWNDVIPPKKLYTLDIQIAQIDPAWPVTAPQPNNIHFNPKFFKKPTTTTSLGNIPTTTTSTIPKTTPIIPDGEVDEKTLSMQQKLIDKHRELLELRQRKLELELLQTQVKLQEQLKSKTPTTANTSTIAIVPPVVTAAQNMLLKQDVPRQLTITSGTSKTTSVTTNAKMKTGTHSVSSVMNAKLLHNASANAIPRIAPVQSNLANARPTRDPRLLRHQQQQQQLHSQSQLQQSQSHHKNSTNVQLETKSKSLVNNKGNIESHGKSKTLPHSSPLKHTQKIGSSLRKGGKFSREVKFASAVAASDIVTSVAPDSRSTSNSLSSTAKANSKSDLKNRLPNNKSPSKNKKKNRNLTRSDMATNRSENNMPLLPLSNDKDSNLLRYEKTTTTGGSGSASFRTDKDNSALVRTDKKIESSNKHSANKNSKSENKDKSRSNSNNNKSEITTTITSFKDLKGSTKNRNYMRRNRNTTPSPEPASQDVDLRLRAPPEKQPRLQGDISDAKNSIVEGTTSDLPQTKDVDLRQLSTVISKKRPSTDSNETIPNAKKSKTEMFHVLFGSEDIDLRQLPPAGVMSPKGADRPPTPPPPIISETKTSSTNRRHSTSEAPINKIIISPADEESIKTGNMTKAQETALMNKIIAQIETQKLREAQRKESESLGSITLQPISDDELAEDFSGNESDGDIFKRIISPRGIDKDTRGLREDQSKEEPQHIREKEDRIVLSSQNTNQSEEQYVKFPRTMEQHRDPRSNRPWRGRHRPKCWDNMLAGPLPRPGIRPPIRSVAPPELWMRPMNETWRGMGPPVPPLYHNNFGSDSLISNMPPHLLEQGNHSPGSNNSDIPVLEYAPPNSFKFMTIDGEPREIRYYDETAIVFMSSGDPREITFHNGQRRIFFDGEPYTLKFNHPYEEISIKGQIHRVRLGAPSREIFIDGKGYECYFDQNEKAIDLDGNKIMVKLEPPPPQVNIGQEKRLDLVAGKIQLVLDAKHVFTIFLDAKPQTFQLNGVTHSLRFVNALWAVLINDVRYAVEFGGLPIPVMLHGTKHFIRFSVLPKGIKAGHVNIKDMEVCQSYENPKIENETSQDGFPTTQMITPTDPLIPVMNLKKPLEDDSPERSAANSPQNIIHQQNFNNFNMLSSVLSSSMAASSTEGYKVENTNSANDLHQDVQANTAVSNALNVPIQPTNPLPFNINDLYQRLVATGIVTTGQQPPAVPAITVTTTTIEQPAFSPPKPSTRSAVNNTKQFKVDFCRPETLKLRRSPLIQSLYLGMQCSSCGMRFPPEHSMYYSQHLDWHFRQNRRGKKNIRKASSRRWYYTFSDWKNYEELEDLEEREKCYFENQQQNQNEGANEEGEEEIEVPCVSADPNVQNAICEVCQDRFEQFYNEEKDEWQIRMAVRVDNKTYHPLCYEDYQASLVDVTLDEIKSLDLVAEPESNSIPLLDVDNEESNKKEEEIGNEEDEVMEVIENIDDDDVSKGEEQKHEEQIENNAEDDDDDVIINEVIPEKIVLDDDYEPPVDNGLIPGVVVKEEPIDDGFIDIGNGVVKMKTDTVRIKNELVDNDESELHEMLQPDLADTTHIEVVSSIDGNVELDYGVPTPTGIGGKIKINITKPLPAIVPKENRDVVGEQQIGNNIDPSQPLPPGEEPVQLNVKPALKGLDLKRQPPVKKGSELTGLCSIM